MQHSPYLKDRPRRSPQQALAEIEDRRWLAAWRTKNGFGQF